MGAGTDAWPAGLGSAGALAAATAGFLDLCTIAIGTPAYRKAVLHMTLNLAVIFAYVTGFGWRSPVTSAAS